MRTFRLINYATRFIACPLATDLSTLLILNSHLESFCDLHMSICNGKSVDVSVLIPVYNEEKYLRDSLLSVIHSAVGVSVEIIVVDDHSNDDSFAIAKKLSCEFPCIKAYKNSGKGKASAYNFAFSHASGKSFVLFAGDDLMVPGSLADRVFPLLVEEGKVITTARYKTISEIKRFNGIVVPKRKGVRSRSGGTIAFNKAFAEDYFPIPEILKNEDKWLDCHIKYFNDVKIKILDNIVIHYRIHEKNSLKQGVSFSIKTNDIHGRSICYSIFLEKYRLLLIQDDIEELEALSALETMRWRQSTLSIIFFKGAVRKDKLRALIYSSNVLYFFYNKLYRYLTGILS